MHACGNNLDVQENLKFGAAFKDVKNNINSMHSDNYYNCAFRHASAVANKEIRI